MAFTLALALLAGSWHGVRAVGSGAVLDAYEDDYIARYVPLRAKFDFQHYFTTFYLTDLADTPNRDLAVRLTRRQKRQDPHANSFFTLLYSEVWGDHWLYFSGKKGEETKALHKRRLFYAALIPTLWWAARTVSGMGTVIARYARHERRPGDLIVLTTFVLGVAMFLWWQTGPALLPGKNSTIKFIYNAHLFPLSLVLAYVPPVSRVEFVITCFALAVLFALALPIAVFHLP